jgi:hypothetical protein
MFACSGRYEGKSERDLEDRELELRLHTMLPSDISRLLTREQQPFALEQYQIIGAYRKDYPVTEEARISITASGRR